MMEKRSSTVLKNFSYREKVIAFVCLTVIFIFFIYSGVYKTVTRHLDDLDQKILLNKGRLKKNLAIVSKANDFEKKYAQFLTTFKQTKSDEQVMASMISEIESVGRMIDLRITETKPQKGRKSEFFNNFSVSLAMNGTLDQITHFLFVLQTEPHSFSVDELSIEKNLGQMSSLSSRVVLSRVLIP